MRKKIILLNPPGNGKRYLRDYYCSKISKANYVYQPVDLLILSGILFEHFQIKVIDAIIENISEKECLRRVKDYSPNAVIFITGAVSRNNDFAFIKQIKDFDKNILTLASGDFLMEDGEGFLKGENSLDAVILDFTSQDIVAYLQGERGSLSSIIHKVDNIVVGFSGLREKGEFRIPVPRHELFIHKKYSYPFVKRRAFATVLTDYGCPFKCSFCIMPSVGYKYRPVEDIIKELTYLKSLHINEIYFADQTFGANRNRAMQLSCEFKRLFPRLGWVCFSRVDLINEELLSQMKAGGCHTIIFGIESGNSHNFKKLKGFDRSRVIDVIRLCQKYKIRTVGTFMIGLPGDTKGSIRETINFAKHHNFDYASFNIAIPRAGTELKKEVVLKNLWDNSNLQMDQSGSFAVMGTGYLSAGEVERWHKKAIKEFYLRPGYLLRKLSKIRSWQEFRINFSEGLSLLTGH